MAKPEYIAQLERRRYALEDEIAEALANYADDDLMIADLKGRVLNLRDELERLKHEFRLDYGLH